MEVDAWFRCVGCVPSSAARPTSRFTIDPLNVYSPHWSAMPRFHSNYMRKRSGPALSASKIQKISQRQATLEKMMASYPKLAVESLSKNTFSLLLSNGAVATVIISDNGDIVGLKIDKTLVEKFPLPATAGILTSWCIVLASRDGMIHFVEPKKSNRFTLPSKLGEIKIATSITKVRNVMQLCCAPASQKIFVFGDNLLVQLMISERSLPRLQSQEFISFPLNQPNSDRLFVSCDGCTVALWRHMGKEAVGCVMKSVQQIQWHQQLKTGNSPITFVQPNPLDIRVAAIGLQDGTIIVSNAEGQLAKRIMTAVGLTAAWHPAGILVVISFENGDIGCFDVALNMISLVGEAQGMINFSQNFGYIAQAQSLTWFHAPAMLSSSSSSSSSLGSNATSAAAAASSLSPGVAGTSNTLLPSSSTASPAGGSTPKATSGRTTPTLFPPPTNAAAAASSSTIQQQQQPSSESDAAKALGSMLNILSKKDNDKDSLGLGGTCASIIAVLFERGPLAVIKVDLGLSSKGNATIGEVVSSHLSRGFVGNAVALAKAAFNLNQKYVAFALIIEDMFARIHQDHDVLSRCELLLKEELHELSASNPASPTATEATPHPLDNTTPNRQKFAKLIAMGLRRVTFAYLRRGNLEKAFQLASLLNDVNIWEHVIMWCRELHDENIAMAAIKKLQAVNVPSKYPGQVSASNDSSFWEKMCEMSGKSGSLVRIKNKIESFDREADLTTLQPEKPLDVYILGTMMETRGQLEEAKKLFIMKKETGLVSEAQTLIDNCCLASK